MNDRQQQFYGRAEKLTRTVSNRKRQIVVFGIFDGVHEGHRDFFRQGRVVGASILDAAGKPTPQEALNWSTSCACSQNLKTLPDKT